MMATVDPDRNRVAVPARKLMKSAAVVLALLFVMLRPVCEAFAAPGHHHGAGVSENGTLHSAVPGSGYGDDPFCCASVYAQSLTAPATPPLTLSDGVLAAPYFATPGSAGEIALQMNVLARRDPAPPLPYHARSLRRLD